MDIIKNIVKLIKSVFNTVDLVKFTRVPRRIESVRYYLIRDGF
jgi:hypothetical protein